MFKHSNPGFHPQRGAVLFVALVFLVLLTLLGLTAAGTSVLQERMVGGMRNSQMAMMGAESALRGGEFSIWIAPQSSAAANRLSLYCSVNGTGGCYAPLSDYSYDTKVQQFRSTQTWMSASSDGGTVYTPTVSSLSGSTKSASLAEQPQYLIQMVGPDLPAGSSGGAGGSLQQQYGNGPGNQTKFIYTITARSTGGSSNVVRVAESTFSALRAQY